MDLRIPEQADLFQAHLETLSVRLSILPDKNEENAHNTLCALWHAASGTQVSSVTAIKLALPVLLPNQQAALDDFIQSRLQGVPLAHLTQRQHFMGLEYVLGKGLYIPRKETELLAETAIATINEERVGSEEVVAIDLCTGIGTVALAMAHHCTRTSVYGSDIYGRAIAAAKANARHLRLEQRARFFEADLFQPFESASLKNGVDIIVSAPPYISSAKVKTMAAEIADHEPEEAFDAGPFGLSIFNKIIAQAPEYLKRGGHLLFECGLGQGEFLAKRIGANKLYRRVLEVRDALGEVRVLKATRA